MEQAHAEHRLVLMLRRAAAGAVITALTATPSPGLELAKAGALDCLEAMDALGRRSHVTLLPPAARRPVAPDTELALAAAGSMMWLDEPLDAEAYPDDPQLTRAIMLVIEGRDRLAQARDMLDMQPAVYDLGPLTVDAEDAYVGGTPCGLGPVQLKLITLLAGHAGRVVTSREIDRVLERTDQRAAPRPSHLIRAVRARLAAAGGDPEWISPLRGRGPAGLPARRRPCRAGVEERSRHPPSGISRVARRPPAAAVLAP